MATALSILLSLQVWATCVTAQEFLSVGTDNYIPDHLWVLDKNYHGYSSRTKTLYAILHDVSLTSGPLFNGNAAGAMYFKGASSSYAEIPYSKGELDASMDFSWTMLLKPDSLSGNGVILEYWDGVGGIRVKQVGSTVVVEAQDVNNFTYNITIQKVFTETNGATDWIFLGVCYIYVKVKPDPGFKIYNEYYTKTGSGYTSKVDNGTVLRGKGPVRLGGSVLSTQPPFAGSISCLRFHTKFINKFAVDYASQCDPKGTFTDQYNLTEYTRDYDSTSTTILTTATTAKTSAADETTSGALPVTTTPTVVDIPQVRETCYRLIRQLSGGKISQRHVLAQNPVNSLGACANQCALFPGCAAISVQKSVVDGNGGGLCVLGNASYDTTADGAFYLYRFA
ncbi:uncharacterized protein LOC112553400 [Pomacea canaliculata]|uniref:uncharacterized protein LOC112553400 n=1 Tax=Pomacea canaliculata TaxID=400727 RepID=UPI000D727A19|nr:uncharacterized protein LOC112553400 [Pomacea canaliculata]XP_025076379.1 uncharacterized protein LOC112553400 [Pomacea canaliculata]